MADKKQMTVNYLKTGNFNGIPVTNNKLLSELSAGKPTGTYFESYPLEQINPISEKDPFFSKMLKEYNQTPYSLSGYTNPKAYPTEAWVNAENNFLGNQFGTLIHEQQHLIDKQRGKNESRYPFPQDYSEASSTEKPNWISDAQWSDYKLSQAGDTKKDLTALYRKYKDKYHLAGDFYDEGIFPELKRIGATNPGGIMATDIGQELFSKNPELKETYWERTRPENTTYMTNFSESPRYKWESSKDKKQSLIDELLNKTKGYLTY